MTTPPEPPAPPPAGEALAPRVTAIETEQTRQGGILERIEGLLTGRDDTNHTTRGDDPGETPEDMAEQMRQAVRDVQAEQAAAAPAAPPAETTPREVMVRGKDKLQGWLFGGDKK